MGTEGTEIVVAVPTYNNAETIDGTLDVLFGQTRRPDRIVFCDKSTDDTRERIRAYVEDVAGDVNEDVAEGADEDVAEGADEGIAEGATEGADEDADEDADDRSVPRVEIVDQDGDGVADAYDRILRHVAGEYDLFVTLQSDLLVDEDWLAGHERLHDERPEIDVVNGDKKTNEPTDREVEPDDRPYYVGRNFSAKAGTLEAIDGWDPNFLRGEDWDMRIRLAGAGTRSYARTALGYTWQTDDPYITLSKAKRRPTAATFLAKFGTWYLRFHPSHVISDGLSVTAVVLAVLTPVALVVSPLLGVLLGIGLVGVVAAFAAAHNLLRGGVDGKRLVGPVRKQFLNGIAVLYALGRLAGRDHDWNMAGFEPDRIPHYRF